MAAFILIEEFRPGYALTSKDHEPNTLGYLDVLKGLPSTMRMCASRHLRIEPMRFPGMQQARALKVAARRVTVAGMPGLRSRAAARDAS